MKGLLISQKITFPFFYMNLLNLTVYSVISYFTIIILKLGLDGFLIAYYTKLFLESIILVYCAWKYNTI